MISLKSNVEVSLINGECMTNRMMKQKHKNSMPCDLVSAHISLFCTVSSLLFVRRYISVRGGKELTLPLDCYGQYI